MMMFSRTMHRTTGSRALCFVQRRSLHLHEYQTKDLMEQFGVKVQVGRPATTATGAAAIAADILASNPSADLVLKAQIQAGGRGKGSFVKSRSLGGVQILKTVAEVEAKAELMLGDNLITLQTPPEGLPVDTVLVNEGIDILAEYYFAILLDRVVGGPCFVASRQGGMDIEKVAVESPEEIVVVPIDINVGVTEADIKVVSTAFGLTSVLLRKKLAVQIIALYDLFIASDATQVEM